MIPGLIWKSIVQHDCSSELVGLGVVEDVYSSCQGAEKREEYRITAVVMYTM